MGPYARCGIVKGPWGKMGWEMGQDGACGTPFGLEKIHARIHQVRSQSFKRL